MLLRVVKWRHIPALRLRGKAHPFSTHLRGKMNDSRRGHYGNITGAVQILLGMGSQ